MELNEKILQSKTALELLKFIEELWELSNVDIDMNIEMFVKMEEKLDYVRDKATKAKNKEII